MIMRDDDPIDKGQFQAKFFYETVNVYRLQQNVFLVMNFSEENFFVTKNLHLVTKFEFRHQK